MMKKKLFLFQNKDGLYSDSGLVTEKSILPIGFEFKLNSKKYTLQLPSRFEVKNNDSISVVGKKFGDNIIVHAINNYSNEYQYKQSPVFRFSAIFLSLFFLIFLYMKYGAIGYLPNDIKFIFTFVIILVAMAVLFYIKHLMYI